MKGRTIHMNDYNEKMTAILMTEMFPTLTVSRSKTTLHPTTSRTVIKATALFRTRLTLRAEPILSLIPRKRSSSTHISPPLSSIITVSRITAHISRTIRRERLLSILPNRQRHKRRQRLKKTVAPLLSLPLLYVC